MKILYLEDNPSDAELTLHTLRSAEPGIQVDIVNLLRDALTKVTQNPPPDYDLVLTDLNVPDGDGLEFLSHIRSNNLPYAVVVVTGRSDEETIISALKAGADDYIIKREDYLSRLPNTLDSALKRYSAAVALHARPLNVLYAEATQADIDLTLRHMQKNATHIHTDVARNAEGVIQLLRNTEHQKYDVILLDSNLPDVNALDILKEISETRKLSVPVVLVTDQGSEDIVLQAMRLGAADYVVKSPGYLLHLPAVIENAYHRHRLMEEQAALREAETKYRMLVEQVPAAIYMDKIDDISSTIFIGPQIETISGYTAEEWMSNPGLWQSIIHPEDRDRVMKENLQTNQTEESFSLEYRLIARDGHIVWVRDEAQLIHDDAGVPRFWQGVLLDITERKLSEEALHRRDAIMEAVSFEAERFLSSRWEDSIQAVLERIGTADDVSRAYIFKIHTDADGRIRADQLYEWVATGIAPQINNPEMTNFDFHEQGFDHLLQRMSQRKPIYRNARDFSVNEERVFSSQDILSLVCVPIFVGDFLWGFIGLDECRNEREWPTIEVEALRAAANILGAAIRRVHTEEALQRQLQELIILHSIATDSVQSTNIDELIERVTATLGSRLHPDNFGLLLLDETGKQLRHHRSYVGVTEEVKALMLQPNMGIVGRVFTTGQPRRVSNVQQDPDFIEIMPNIHSEVCIPVKAGGRVIGVINLESHEYDFFTADDERLLVTAAGQLATAIENIRHIEVERQRLQESEILRQAAAIISTSLELHAVLEMIQNSLKRVIPYDSSTVFLIEGNTLRAVAANGFSNISEIIDRHYDHLGSLFEEIQRTRQVVIISDTEENPQFEHWGNPAIRSWIGVPLIARDEVIGFLTLDSCTPGAYDSSLSILAETYAYQAAAAINNAQLFEETRRRLKEMEAVNRISTNLRVAQTPSEMLPLLLDETLSVLNMQAGSIWLYEPSQDDLYQVVARGWFSQLSLTRRKHGEGLAGYIFSTGKPHITEDISKNRHIDPTNRSVIPQGWNCAGIPIHAATETIGVLFISGNSSHGLHDDEISLLNTLAEIAGTAIHRVMLHNKTEQQVERLTALRDIDIAISSSFDLRVTLDILLDHTLAQLKIDAANVLLFNPYTQMLEFAAGRGFRTHAATKMTSRLGEGTAGRIALSHRTQTIPDIRVDHSLLRDELSEEGFILYVGVPLVAKGQIKGVFEVFHRSVMPVTNDWLEFLQAMGSQAAIAIDNAQLFNNLQRSNLELALAYDTTLEGWGKALEMRDRQTEGHTLRVTQLTMKLATTLGVSDQELLQIRRGALLHDIGKMGVPDHILRKTGSLTGEEWEIMRKHVEYAFNLLYPIEYLRKAIDIPYCHHERWDGTGYPRGLKGEAIPKAARIFTIVDVWDALMSDRPYRKAWSKEHVIEYITEHSGKIFDPAIAKTFLDLVERGEID
jgi:PAS domain S-box-containing protein/putative nucleotidyltransferase with HDIG domain